MKTIERAAPDSRALGTSSTLESDTTAGANMHSAGSMSVGVAGRQQAAKLPAWVKKGLKSEGLKSGRECQNNIITIKGEQPLLEIGGP